MRIAIIGGGAAGLVTAWYLRSTHDVQVYEQSPILGGHVRTLNRNVLCPALHKSICIENGVLGFQVETYPHVMQLMQELNVPLIYDQPSAKLYHGQSVYPSGITALLRNRSAAAIRRHVGDIGIQLGMWWAYKRFMAKLNKLSTPTTTSAATHGELSGNVMLREMQRALLMLSFSTPFEHVDQLPQGLTFPYLQGLRHPDWVYVEGGVYAYMERILKDLPGRVHAHVAVEGIRRDNGVVVQFRNGDRIAFDKVVIATSPGVVSGLLMDATDEERRRFAPWKDHVFTTIAHTDERVYEGVDRVERTPMDLFARPGKSGYNTSMNRGYGIPGLKQYAFAYQLEDRIDTSKRLDRQNHIVPCYIPKAWNVRKEILETNGQNNTYFAGAWLGNGLHEGAVSSARQVARILGA